MKTICTLCFAILAFICGTAKAHDLFTYAAPDRIGLLSKTDLDAFNMTRARTATKAAYLIQLNESALKLRQFMFTDPDGTKYEFTGKRTEVPLEMGFNWYGELTDKSGSIRFNSDGVYILGVVHLPKGRVFAIRSPSPGVHFLVEVILERPGDDTPTSVGSRELPPSSDPSSRSVRR